MMNSAESDFPPDEEGFKVEAMAGTRAKPRFSYTEVKVLLEAIKRNRYILLRRFNQGVSADAKKHTWTEITEQINSLGENHREVRQIMKKWADLKCDGKRRIIAMRGPNGRNLRKKNLGPVERMVHKILMMSPKGDGESDVDLDDHFSNLSSSSYSSINLPESSYTEAFKREYTTAAEMKPADYGLDFEDEEDEDHYSLMESEEILRARPTYTYSRHGHSSSTPRAQSPSAPHTAAPGQSSAPSEPPSPPLARSVQQQRAARLLLASVAQSVESLARSLQLLMERQQEFVQESLQLQRQSVEMLRDFSHTALTVLRAQPHQRAVKPLYIHK